MAEYVNTDVNYGVDFFAEQVSVSHSPVRFVINFVRNTPRIDVVTRTTKMLKSYDVVMLDPYLAKEFVSVLSDNINKYEKKFGVIKKPEPLQKFEKYDHKHSKKQSKQDYFG